MAEWFHELVDHLGFDRNTALVALSYLDTYSMSVCFPEEFSRRVTKTTTTTGGEDDRLPPPSPSPPKRRRSNHPHQDDFWEFVEDRSRRRREEDLREEAVRRFEETHYRLAALASFYVAGKIHQSSTAILSPSEFARFVRHRFSARQVEVMEIRILCALGFRVHPPTALRFVQELMPAPIGARRPPPRGVPTRTSRSRRSDLEARRARPRRAKAVSRQPRVPFDIESHRWSACISMYSMEDALDIHATLAIILHRPCAVHLQPT